MSKLEQLREELCPDGVEREWKTLGELTEIKTELLATLDANGVEKVEEFFANFK